MNGLDLDLGIIQTSGAGSIRLNGTSGKGGLPSFGMILAGTIIRTTGSGDIDFTGLPEAGFEDNAGVRILGNFVDFEFGSLVEAQSTGSITITGVGGETTVISENTEEQEADIIDGEYTDV